MGAILRITFRVDASLLIGTGHVMRCRTLATAFKKKGADIQFISRAHSGHLGDVLARENFEVTLLPVLAEVEGKENNYTDWLGVSQQEDADQTIVALQNQPCDWIIVDHYGLDGFWETRLQAHTKKMMVIDDLANRPHQCDILLDQNYAEINQARYQSLVPVHCRLLLGPRYALLRPEYLQCRETSSPRSGNVQRVLVFMGGGDNDNITGKVLDALSASSFAHLQVDVVIGPNFVHKEQINKQASMSPNTRVYGPRLHLADLMEKADCAIGAGGGTTWERLCLGLPSMVFSIAENQVPACEALASSKFIWYLGDGRKLSVATIESALFDALEEIQQSCDLENNYKALVDGRGTDRIVEALYPTPVEELTLRAANNEDALTYFAWVNDPAVRLSAINSELIDLSEHLKWFDKQLMDMGSYLFVLEAGTLPVGQIRFERCRVECTISYSLDFLVRGRGWANYLLKCGIKALSRIQPIRLKAVVKSENSASIAAFIRLGFTEQSDNSEKGNIRNFYFSLSQVRDLDF